MTNFLRFWNALNQLQQAQGLSDVLYGQARDLFAASGLPR